MGGTNCGARRRALLTAGCGRKGSLGRAFVAAAALTAGLAWGATPALAQATTPFECLTGQVFLAQGAPTQLKVGQQGAGNITFANVGPVSTYSYNAIGFNRQDNFIYAIGNGPGHVGHLLRIDSQGRVTDLGPAGGGTGINSVAGTFDIFGNYYVFDPPNTLWRVNVTNNTKTAIPLSQDISGVADITNAFGFLWGIDNATGEGIRIDPQTGQVTRFAQTAVPGPYVYGAAWTYGGGNIGFQNNTTGNVYRVRIVNPTGANPGYELVSSQTGPPAQGQNDATSCPGFPADLSVAKVGPSVVHAGQPLTWTLVVTNNGPGNSSGFTVREALPAGVTNVTTSTPGCAVAGGVVTCSEGPLAAGDSFVVQVEGTAPNATGTLTNSATVDGLDEDPTPGNNAATFTTQVVPFTGIPLASPPVIVAFAVAALAVFGWRRRMSAKRA